MALLSGYFAYYNYVMFVGMVLVQPRRDDALSRFLQETVMEKMEISIVKICESYLWITFIQFFQISKTNGYKCQI